jgi:GT2 family glycosyltransferase
MRSVLIVCTRNRPQDVRRLFTSVAQGNNRSGIVVVDSSDDDSTATVTRSFTRMRPRYERSTPGLTRQRMAGVAALDPEVEIVHFVDDDVVLEPGYLAAIEAVFDARPEVLGVGGRITNLPEHNPHLLRRIFLLDCAHGGVVLRSGVNILAFGVPDGGRVQWLSGCSMSFRRRVFHDVVFDTSLEGSCLGEDVDFTFRLGHRGPLCIAGHARLAHMSSEVNRENGRDAARRQVVRRYRWVREMRGKGVGVLAFWWSVAGDILLSSAKGALQLRRAPLRRSLAIIRAIGDIARTGRDRSNASRGDRGSDG